MSSLNAGRKQAAKDINADPGTRTTAIKTAIARIVKIKVTVLPTRTSTHGLPSKVSDRSKPQSRRSASILLISPLSRSKPRSGRSTSALLISPLSRSHTARGHSSRLQQHLHFHAHSLHRKFEPLWLSTSAKKKSPKKNF